MSRIRVNIDYLVLSGFEPLEGNALAKALESQLQQLLADPAKRGNWARPHRTPVLKLGRMPLQAGTSGASRFGRRVANAIGRGLKP